MPKKKRDPKTVALAKAMVEEYQPESVEEMQSALKDVFGPLFDYVNWRNHIQLHGTLNYQSPVSFRIAKSMRNSSVTG
ncbi:hypothetical protein FQR52_07720 [Listeria monocytogenes]|nr:hypothetical protein [Listeria monocytogenes]EEO6566201.1 hypothetical protein [Listeria monocytogenes]EEO7553759.1 hypothetical protein [Listeria monocytogenes]EEO9089495.1 hypothetical protein [Listeria monocytogenes]